MRAWWTLLLIPGAVLAQDNREDQYRNGGAAPDVDMAGGSVELTVGVTNDDTGGSQSHTNVQPFLCVNFIIALVGVYPSRS